MTTLLSQNAGCLETTGAGADRCPIRVRRRKDERAWGGGEGEGWTDNQATETCPGLVEGCGRRLSTQKSSAQSLPRQLLRISLQNDLPQPKNVNAMGDGKGFINILLH